MQRFSILRSTICANRVSSRFPAAIHFLLIRSGLIKSVTGNENHDDEISKIIYYWEIKILRRLISVLVRSPLRTKVLNLVKLNISLPPEGCVILTCHTPWKRLLVEWCLNKQFAIIIAQGKWKTTRSIIQSDCKGAGEIRKLVSFLKNKGRIIIALDVFNNKNDCPVEFRNKDCNASTVPVRLANLAGVPLLTVFPVYKNGHIQFVEGSGLYPGNNLTPTMVIQEIMDQLRKLMLKDPMVCS